MSNARNLANLLTGGDTTIATGDVANGAISTAKLADDAVTAAKIDDDGTGFQMADLTLGTALLPDASGGADIGSTSAEFGDVFIADDKAVKFGNDQDASIEYDENGDDQLKIGGAVTAFTNAVIGKTDTDTSNSGSVTLDFDANQNFVLTLTGAVTLANPTTEKVGQSGFIAFIQDGTGSRAVTLGTDYESAGGAGITLTATAGATDLVPYVVVAANRVLLGTPQLAFS
tara:strand:- start:313 stop:999 length:687 start_codon:yes stop_codon:yes gene_type:complete